MFKIVAVVLVMMILHNAWLMCSAWLQLIVVSAWLMHGWLLCMVHGWLLCDYLHLTQPLTHGRKHAEKFFGCRPHPFSTRLNTMFSQVRGVGGQFLHFRRIGFVLYLCHWQHTNQHQTSINFTAILLQTSINPALSQHQNQR